MPVINPMSGLEHGRLTVVLAMGSLEQISSYQRTKSGSASAVAVAERPSNYLERCFFRHNLYYLKPFFGGLSFCYAVSLGDMLSLVRITLRPLLLCISFESHVAACLCDGFQMSYVI